MLTRIDRQTNQTSSPTNTTDRDEAGRPDSLFKSMTRIINSTRLENSPGYSASLVITGRSAAAFPIIPLALFLAARCCFGCVVIVLRFRPSFPGHQKLSGKDFLEGQKRDSKRIGNPKPLCHSLKATRSKHTKRKGNRHENFYIYFSFGI